MSIRAQAWSPVWLQTLTLREGLAQNSFFFGMALVQAVTWHHAPLGTSSNVVFECVCYIQQTTNIPASNQTTYPASTIYPASTEKGNMPPRVTRKAKALLDSSSPMSPLSSVTSSPQVAIIKIARPKTLKGVNMSPLAGKKRKAGEVEEELVGSSDEEDDVTVQPPSVLDLGPSPQQRVSNVLRGTKASQAPFGVHPRMKADMYNENIIPRNESEVLGCLRYYARVSFLVKCNYRMENSES